MPKFKVSVSSFPNMVCTIKQNDVATFQYQLPSRFALIKNNGDYSQLHTVDGLNYLANFSKDFFPQKSTEAIKASEDKSSEDKSIVAQISFQNPKLDVWYFHQDNTEMTPEDFVKLTRCLIELTPDTSDAAILAATKWHVVDNSWLAIFVKYVAEGKSCTFFSITDDMQAIKLETIPVPMPSSSESEQNKSDKSVSSPVGITEMNDLDGGSDLPFPYCQDQDENKRGYSPLLDGPVTTAPFWGQRQSFRVEKQSTTNQKKVALPFPPGPIEQKNPVPLKELGTRKTEKPELPETASYQKKVALPFPPEPIEQKNPVPLKELGTRRTEEPELPETTSDRKIQATYCTQATDDVFQFLFDYDYENHSQETQEEEPKIKSSV